MDIEVGAEYEHFKGKRYKVLSIAKHSETLEDLVIYQGLYEGGKIWARPKHMFLDKVKVDGVERLRFKKM